MKKIIALFFFFTSIQPFVFANIDLELNLTANKTEYNIYEQITYTLAIENKGNETATGVKVKFPIAPGVAFSNSNASTGSYNLFFQEWTIPSLNANQNTQMILTIFTLNEDGPLPAYAQVIAANQSDTDSTPNNGTCCTANEDDEASLTINPEGYMGGGEADLALVMYKANGTHGEGDEIGVTVRVSNYSMTTATNVTVKVELPNGLTFASNQPSNVNPNTGIITFPEVVQEEALEMRLTVGNVVGEVSIFAQIMSADQTDPDSPHGNDTNQTADEDDEQKLTFSTNITDVSLEMSIDKDEVATNDIVTFTLDAFVNPRTAILTSDVDIEFRLPSNLEYVHHYFGTGFGVEVSQNYDAENGIWQIEAMEFATPHEVSLYQLNIEVKVLGINQPTLVAAEFVAHTPSVDIDSQPNSLPNTGVIYDREDDEAIVNLYPIGVEPARIFGVTFLDGFRQGIDYLVVEKNQGIDHLTVFLYDANDLNNPLQTIETFSNDIFRRGRYSFDHLDPNKNYVLQYSNVGAGNIDFFQGLLPGPVQRSTFLEPNNVYSTSIDIAPNEEIRINYAWVKGETCTLDSAEADAICNDQNTPNPNDDTYNLRYTATGQGAFSLSGGASIPAIEYPNNRLTPAENSYGGGYPRFETYQKWFEAELNLPINGASTQTLTFTNDATFPELDCQETVTVAPPSTCSQIIDMELLFFEDLLAEPTEGTNPNNVDLVIFLYNKGTATAENVEVEMYLPETGFPDGKFLNKTFTLSQGSFEEETQLWTVGNLPAGEKATLRLNALPPTGLVDGQTIPLFAQVTRAHGYDADSDVNNDTDQTPDEDDESLIIFGDNRKMDFEIVDFYPLQSSYNQAELVEFFVEVRNSTDSEIELDDVTIVLDLPDNFEYESFDFMNCLGNCFFDFPEQGISYFNLQPGESASTVIRYTVTDFIGTVDVFVQAIAQLQGDIDSSPNNGVCCTPMEDDEAYAQVQITGDTTQEGVDLELQYSANPLQFNRWTHVDYVLTASNTGTEAATNIVIDVPIPNGLAFTSQSSSKGNFNLFFQTWMIPNLAAGESATLDLRLFTLVNESITTFAQVKSLDQTDSDSTPNNNSSNVPQEDDEAAVTITPVGSSGGKNALTNIIDQSTTLALYELFPVPALDYLQVVFGTAGNQVSVLFYDVHGKLVQQSSHRVLKGENALSLEVSDLTAGFYTISLETPEGFVRGKFLKQ